MRSTALHKVCFPCPREWQVSGSASGSAHDHLTRFDKGVCPCSSGPLAMPAGADPASHCRLLVMASATAVPTKGSPLLPLHMGLSVSLQKWVLRCGLRTPVSSFLSCYIFSRSRHQRAQRTHSLPEPLLEINLGFLLPCSISHTSCGYLTQILAHGVRYHHGQPLVLQSTLAQRPFHIGTYFPRDDLSHFNSFFPWAGATACPFLGARIPSSAHFSVACCPFSGCYHRQEPLICEVRDKLPEISPQVCPLSSIFACWFSRQSRGGGSWLLDSSHGSVARCHNLPFRLGFHFAASASASTSDPSEAGLRLLRDTQVCSFLQMVTKYF